MMLGKKCEEGGKVALIGRKTVGRGAPLAGEPLAPFLNLFKKIARRQKGNGRLGPQTFSPSHCLRQCSSTRARKVSSSVPWPALK